MGDKPYTNTVDAGERGYNCLIRKNGQVGVYLRTDGSTVTSVLSSTGAVEIEDDEEIDLRLVVTPTQVKFQRLSAGSVITEAILSNPVYRGGCLHFTRSNSAVKIKQLRVKPN